MRASAPCASCARSPSTVPWWRSYDLHHGTVDGERAHDAHGAEARIERYVGPDHVVEAIDCQYGGGLLGAVALDERLLVALEHRILALGRDHALPIETAHID